MKKDTIVQFVCFITNLEFAPFAAKWEQFTKPFMKKNVEIILQQQTAKKARFKYISQHQWPQEDFQFAFMDKKGFESFPEYAVKVVQTGGYTPMQIGTKNNGENGYVKVMAFISHNENDLDFYKELKLYKYLNIYQAYFESCTYAYVLEYFLKEEQVPELMEQLKTRNGTEAAAYEECPATYA
jgi:hypothetical protein